MIVVWLICYEVGALLQQLHNISTTTTSTNFITYQYLLFYLLFIFLGTYQAEKMQGFCSDCPAGNFCPNRASKLTPCPARYYCLERTEYPEICPNGTFSYDNDTGFEKPEDCRPCISGHFCYLGKLFYLKFFTDYLIFF